MVNNDDGTETQEFISFNLTLIYGNTAPPNFSPRLKDIRMQAG